MNPDGTAAPQMPAQPHAPHAVVQLPGVPALEVGAWTDPGRDPNKQVNEDAMAARETPHGHLAVVCDGMGGHVGGREASHLAIETIFHHFDATAPGTPPQQVLGDALRQANAAVWARGQASPELKGMGSTCVAILTHAGGTEIAHVGDSRVYLLTQAQVYQVTKDHSLVQRLVDANMLTPEQAANHPNANQITNAFGQRPDVEVEIRPQPFPHGLGDTFVLCSDGLSDEVGPQDLLRVFAPYPSPLDAARQLVDLANARGGHDNITVIVVRFAGGGPFALPAADAIPGASTTAPSAQAPTTAEMEIVAPDVLAQQAPQAAPVAPVPLSTLPASTLPTSTMPTSAPAFAPPPPFTATPIEPVEKKGGGKGLVVAIVLVLLLVAGGVAAALLLRGSDAQPAPEGAAPSSTVEEDETATATTKPTASAPKPIPKPSIDLEPDASAKGPRKPVPSGQKPLVPSTSDTVKNVPLDKPAAPPTATTKLDKNQ